MAEEKNSQFRGDMLDIIFATRNKSYGAYQLRRSYPEYLMRALGFGLLLVAFFMVLPYILNAVSGALAAREKPVDAEIEMTAPPDIDKNEPPPPPPPPPPTPPPPVKATVAFVPPIIKPDEEVPEEQEKIENDKLDTVKQIAKITQAGDDDPDPGTMGEGNGLQNAVVSKAEEPEKTYEQFDVSKLPSFPGGEAELQKYLSTNIKYPAIAKENNIQGTVALSFVVEKDGSLSNIKILKDPGGGCGKEAVRVLESMPRWTPGEAAGGNKVKVKFTLPVRFRLE